MQIFWNMLLVLFAASGLSLFGVPSAKIVKKAARPQEVFLLLDQALKSSSSATLTPEEKLKNGMSIEDSILLLGRKGLVNQLNVKRGSTLLKNFFKKGKKPLGVLELLLAAGASSEVPTFKRGGSSKKIHWKHFLPYAVSMGNLKGEVIALSFSPEFRPKVFSGGFETALKVFNELTEMNSLTPYKRGRIRSILFYLKKWALEENKSFDDKGFSFSSFEASKSGEHFKSNCLIEFFSKNKGCGLHDFVPALEKTVEQVIEDLFESGKIANPCYTQQGKLGPGLLYVAFKNRLKNDVIELLVKYKAPVMYQVQKNRQMHVLLGFIISLPRNNSIKAIFDSSAQRRYFFNDDPAVARDLLARWKEHKYGAAVEKKINFFKTCILDWEQKAKEVCLGDKQDDIFDNNDCQEISIPLIDESEYAAKLDFVNESKFFNSAVDTVVYYSEQDVLDQSLQELQNFQPFERYVLEEFDSTYFAFDISKINSDLLAVNDWM